MADESTAEAYERHEGFLKAVCRQFVTQRGGDFDEALGEARLKFLEVWRTFDPDLGIPFEGYLKVCVTRRLRDLRNAELRRKRVWGTSCTQPATETGLTIADMAEDYRSSEFFDAVAFCAGFESRLTQTSKSATMLKRRLLEVLVQSKVPLDSAGCLLAAVQPLLAARGL